MEEPKDYEGHREKEKKDTKEASVASKVLFLPDYDGRDPNLQESAPR